MKSETQFNSFSKLIDRHGKFDVSNILPSDFAEKNVYLDKSVSPANPSQFSYDYTPYTREIVDCLSPEVPVHTIAVMKAAQIGASQGIIVNGILWIIKHSPGPTMLLSGDKDLSKEFVEQRLDPAIDSAGLRGLITPKALRQRKARTGDTSFSKEFAGGQVNFDGIQNLGKKMRQITVQNGFYDDWESAPRSDKKGGDPYSLTQTRVMTLGYRRKCFFMSSPEIEQTSNIYPLYLRGDQRKWHVQCPRCGEQIPLEWQPLDNYGKHIKINKKKTGIIYGLEKDLVVRSSIRYRCQICGDIFTEREKFDAVPKGKYIPTSISKEEGFRSYHISGLLSPPGQKGWHDFCTQYHTACPPHGKVDREKYRTFKNTVEGLPFREMGKSIKSNHLARKNIRSYQIGIIPEALSIKDGNGKIVLITIGIDLNGLTDDARVDYEIVAYSESGASYSIRHGSFGSFKRKFELKNMSAEDYHERNKIRDIKSYHPTASNNVWEDITKLKDTIFKTDTGQEMRAMFCLIDCSNTYSDEGGGNQRAYSYIDTMVGASRCVTLGIKGSVDFTSTKINADSPYFKPSKERQNLYILEVNNLKDDVASNIEQIWHKESGKQPKGFMNFPQPDNGLYGLKNYFDHYSSEHKIMLKNDKGINVGYGWDKRTSIAQNHHLDTRVYAEAGMIMAQTLVTKEADLPNSWEAFCQIMKS